MAFDIDLMFTEIGDYNAEMAELRGWELEEQRRALEEDEEDNKEE